MKPEDTTAPTQGASAVLTHELPPASFSTLTATWTGPEGTAHRGQIVGLAGDVVRLAFQGDETLCLPIGTEVELLFSDSELERDIKVRARAVARKDGAELSYYEFHGGQEARADLARLQNHRNDFRVFPHAAAPIEVRATTEEGESYRAMLRDISATGAGLFFPVADEEKLHSARTLTIEFTLPGELQPLKLGARICHRTLAGQAVAYGMQFDPNATTNFFKQQRRVRAYCQRRQFEVRRHALERNTRQTG